MITFILTRKPRKSRDLKSGENIFDAVRKRDILMHHPYESFDPVLEMIQQAVNDPDVLSIKNDTLPDFGFKITCC